MSSAATKTMLESYRPQARVFSFFTSLCRGIYFNTQQIEYDIEREDEDVAVALQSLEQGARDNVDDLYTNKEVTPPVYKERISLDGFQLQAREPGALTHGELNFQAIAHARALKGFGKIERKIRRAVELQASEVFQTGNLNIKNAAGVTIFPLDYKPKSAHFANVGAAWSSTSAPGLDHLESHADTIYKNGKAPPTKCVFGRTSWKEFLNLTQVQTRLDMRRLDSGSVNKPQNIGGATYHGDIVAGPYTFELWTYNGWYKDPVTGNKVPYLGDEKVVMWGEQTDVIAAFGAIPKIPGPQNAQALQYLPPRINPALLGGAPTTPFDMTVSAWLSDDQELLTLQAGSRPIVIPRGIDTFGCLTT